MTYRMSAVAFATASLFAALAHAQTGLGSAVHLTPASIEPPVPFALGGGAAKTITLPPVEHARLAAFKTEQTASDKPGTPFKIGFSRAVDTAQAPFDGRTASWTRVAGGFASKIEVHSPNAQGLRAGIVVDGPSAGVTLRFAGNVRPNEIHDMAATDATERDVNWGPLVQGDTLTIEVFVAEGVAPRSVRFSIPRVMHVDTFPTDARPRNTRDIGSAGACIPDIACKANPSAQFTALAKSVAKISFVVSGGEALCSGTLVNSNTSPRQPYFVTANHCINTQTAASSITSYWFFDATGCNTDRVGTFVTLQGGADLVFNNRGFDHSLVRFRRAVPSGVTFAGWTPQPVATRTPILGIHHPSGDLKKFSEGAKTADVTNQIGLAGPFHEVVWTNGVTEGGSSGSGLFILDNESKDYRLIGQLLGGSSFCTAQSDPDVYGRFQDVYGSVKSFLDNPAPSLAVVSSASFKSGPAAPAQLVSGFGAALPVASYTASTSCPTELGGRYSVDVRYTPAGGTATTTKACVLFIGGRQVNFLMPDAVASAQAATVSVFDRLQNRSIGELGGVSIGSVSPGLYTANASGSGIPAANIIRVLADGTQRQEPVPTSAATGVAIDNASEQVFLILYGTGIRNRAALADVTVTVAGVPAAVEFAGAQGNFVGLDQINVRLPVEALRQAGVTGKALVELKVTSGASTVLTANAVDLYLK